MKFKQILSVLMMLALVLSSVGMVFATEPTSADNTVNTDEDTMYVFSPNDFTFSDDDGDTAQSIRIKSLPTAVGYSFIYIGVPVAVDDTIAFANIQNDYFKYTPASEEFGVLYDSFTFTIIDSSYEESTEVYNLDINVNSVNDAPTLEVDNQNTNEGANFVFNVQAEDIDNDGTDLSFDTFEETSAPVGTTFDITTHFTDNSDGTGTIDWIPIQGDVGDHTFRAIVSDGSLPSMEATFTITVNEVNDAPFVVDPAPNPITVYEDSILDVEELMIVADEENDVITFSIEELESDCISSSFASAVISDDNGDNLPELYWNTPTNDDVGTHYVAVTISDGNSEVTEDIEIVVVNTNDAPIVDVIITQKAWINALTGNGEEFSYQVTVADVDLDVPESTEQLSYTLTGTLPNWGANGGVDLSIDSNGLITGTPNPADNGASYNIEVTVTDSEGESDITSFTLNVDSAYGPEMDAVTTPQAATEDTLFILDFSATDQDSFDSELVFTIVEDSFSASYGTTSTFDTAASLTNSGAGTATLSWAPINDDVGTHTVTVAVTDANGDGMTDEVTFQITVANVNDAPVPEDVSDYEAYENTQFTLQFTVIDPEGDSISVNSWDVDCNEDCDSSSLDLDLGDDLTQNGNTFTITWTPDSDDSDSNSGDDVEHDVEIVFTDGIDTASLHFTITVGEELTGWEIDINDLETQYEDYLDDYENLEDDLRDAEDDDDKNEIDDINDDLESLDDDLKDLEDDLDALEDDIKDDNTLSSSEEDDLLEWIEDIRTDVENLRDDIDDLLKYGTSGSSTDGESASQSSSSSSSSTSSDNGNDSPDVEVTTLNGPSSSGDSSVSSDDNKTTWEEMRGLVWLIACIVIAFAILIFMLAVLLTGGKKQRSA